jgi:hypothetical protein
MSRHNLRRCGNSTRSDACGVSCQCALLAGYTVHVLAHRNDWTRPRQEGRSHYRSQRPGASTHHTQGGTLESERKALGRIPDTPLAFIV